MLPFCKRISNMILGLLYPEPSLGTNLPKYQSIPPTVLPVLPYLVSEMHPVQPLGRSRNEPVELQTTRKTTELLRLRLPFSLAIVLVTRLSETLKMTRTAL